MASGQAALELALEWSGVGPGDEVVVPCDSCYLVPTAVARIGAVPVFAGIGPDLTLDPASVGRAVGARTKAAIAVHHLGLPCDIRGVRAMLPPSVTLIEDAAQAFGLQARGEPLGASSDLVVSSFGPTKPLSLDGGGGVFGDQPELADAVDRYGDARRQSETLPRPYALHPRALTGLGTAVRRARAVVDRRRRIVEHMRLALAAAGLEVWSGAKGDRPSWHRLPVWAPPATRRAAVAADPTGEVVQEPHAVALVDLPLFRAARVVRDQAPGEQPLLLRVRSTAELRAWVERLATCRAGLGGAT